ncbi:hypothetical protein [Vibrio vulnificus]|uniref:hypothetical protein n=1 Tax=Vibrio vulnificus TaxID=672 RepID=UPI001A93841B|nr:hypothetical protein [Vibrio vulnificus]
MSNQKITEIIDKHMKAAVIPDVLAEMATQDVMWGADRNLPPYLWDSILGEEVGEVVEAALLLWSSTLSVKKGTVSKHALEKNATELRKELIQVAAVAMQWIEAIDRSENGDI